MLMMRACQGLGRDAWEADAHDAELLGLARSLLMPV